MKQHTLQTAARLSSISTALIACGLSFTFAPASWAAADYSPQVVYAFGSVANDGQVPASGPTQGSDGNFYGVTLSGGDNGLGTIYRMSPAGIETTLHSFSTPDGNNANTDGLSPFGPLVEGQDGNFYGTTFMGGANKCGVVFKVMPAGDFSVLHTFSTAVGVPPTYVPVNDDGCGPIGPLALGPDGSLYGATYSGGSNGYGALFKLASDGTFSTVHTFTGHSTTEGSNPSAGVIVAADGSIYGPNSTGGTNDYGGVYKVATDGSVSLLTSFPSPQGRDSPPSTVTFGGDGALYGLVRSVPEFIYRLTLDGQFTVLHQPAPVPGSAWPIYSNPDGENYVSLSAGPDGNLYGIAAAGGPFSFPGQSGGALFKITPAGEYTVLDFFGAGIGTPWNFNLGGVSFGSDGSLYGAADGGPTGSFIYKLPLPPPADWGTVTPTVAVTVSPKVIHQSLNQSATLSWNAPNADQCYLYVDGQTDATPVAGIGSMQVAPAWHSPFRIIRYPFQILYIPNSTTYRVTCAYRGKAAAGYATLWVAKT